MNVIVSNLNAQKFSNLDVDVIKTISGEFTVDEIIQSFSNFFFNRMFLDVTAISGYQNVNSLKKLSVGLDVSKIILLLPDDPAINQIYISNLINFGIYNFARTEDELKYLYDNPNSYRDVVHLQNVNDSVPYVNSESSFDISSSDVRVIGFKNLTEHAGATTLIYMLKKVLSKNYYVVAVELNKKDFMFFNDKNMISCISRELSSIIEKYQDANIILLDLNDTESAIYTSLCDDVVYLLDSSVLMINRLVSLDNSCFEKLKNEKIVLNRSLLSKNDIKRFQYEADVNFFAVLPPVNDREDNSPIFIPFLAKLGLYRRV